MLTTLFLSMGSLTKHWSCESQATTATTTNNTTTSASVGATANKILGAISRLWNMAGYEGRVIYDLCFCVSHNNLHLLLLFVAGLIIISQR